MGKFTYSAVLTIKGHLKYIDIAGETSAAFYCDDVTKACRLNGSVIVKIGDSCDGLKEVVRSYRRLREIQTLLFANPYHKDEEVFAPIRETFKVLSKGINDCGEYVALAISTKPPKQSTYEEPSYSAAVTNEDFSLLKVEKKSGFFKDSHEVKLFGISVAHVEKSKVCTIV